MKITKLKNAIENSLWQIMPMLSTLILSLIIVKLFSVGFWGSIVSVLIVQQIANGILNWGNKDYLQRELAVNIKSFKYKICQLVFERLILSFLIILFIYVFEIVERAYFFAFALIVFFKFLSQSFDVLALKERRFVLFFYIDLLVLILQVVMVCLLSKEPKVSINNILLVFWFPYLLKSIVLIFIFRKEFGFFEIKKSLILESFFFGMLAISGLVHSKIDVFVISKLSNEKIVGEYQIIIAFLWSIQSISMFISSPFIHNFYRLNKLSQKNASKLLKTIGFILVPIAVISAMLILFYLFHITVNSSIFIASLIFSISSFIYLPWIFQMLQKKQEHYVLAINIIGSGILVLLLLNVNYFIEVTLEWLVWIAAVHQIFITLFIYIFNKTQKNAY